ncbi:MAG: hypothetical protein H6734_10060 [Alphaproteobacteria bacterium]|nr:hypothetical protein [Alphaproteobacteria bacterium]
MRAVLITSILAGCATHHWTRPDTEPGQRDADVYACMKENAFYGEDASVSRATGARASRGMKVNQELFWACMKAQGYSRQRVHPPGEGAVRAMPDTPRFSTELGVLSGAGFGLSARHISELAPTVASEPVLLSSVVRTNGIVGMHLGATLKVHALADLHVGAVFQGAAREWRLGVDDPASSIYFENEPFGRPGAALAVQPALDLRLRAPFAHRLTVAGGLGFQTLPGWQAESTTMYWRVDDGEDYVDHEQIVQVSGVPGRLLPLARVGIGYDWVVASPSGFRTDCALQGALGGSAVVYQDGVSPPYSETLGFTCGATWVFGLGATP